MERQDRRVRRTQNLLAKALIALTLEKGYEAITIREITERADVGYATFFRHYHDKDALLHDVLEVILDELTELLSPTSNQTNSIVVGTLLFHYVQTHSEVIHVLLKTSTSLSLMQHVTDVSVQSMLRQHAPRADSPVPIEIAAFHLINSSIALIQWWLEHAMPYPPEQMGIIYHHLIAQPTQAVAFSSPMMCQIQTDGE